MNNSACSARSTSFRFPLRGARMWSLPRREQIDEFEREPIAGELVLPPTIMTAWAEAEGLPFTQVPLRTNLSGHFKIYQVDMGPSGGAPPDCGFNSRADRSFTYSLLDVC